MTRVLVVVLVYVFLMVSSVGDATSMLPEKMGSYKIFDIIIK